MGSRLFGLALLSTVLVPALAQAKDNPIPEQRRDDLAFGSDPYANPDKVWRGWVWVDPVEDLAADAAKADISKILFVNRCEGGCVITPGANDARANTSSIAGSIHFKSRRVPPCLQPS